jgi:recombination protein RecA
VRKSRRPAGWPAYIDAENALDPVYAGKLGVNVGDLLISQPDTGEQGSRSPTCWCAPAAST